MELPLEPLHIILCHDLRMYMIIDGIVFRGKAESIPAHGIKHIVSLHPSFPCNDIQRRVRPWMPHMEPLPRRIREFHQCIIFRF